MSNALLAQIELADLRTSMLEREDRQLRHEKSFEEAQLELNECLRTSPRRKDGVCYQSDLQPKAYLFDVSVEVRAMHEPRW